MTTCLFAFLVAWLVAFGSTELVRRASVRLGVLDRPDAYRKRHERPVPSLGGLGIFIAFVVALFSIYQFNPYMFSYVAAGGEREGFGCVLGGALALAIGMVDDIRDLRSGHKLAFQVVPVLVAYGMGCAIHVISLPFVGTIHLGWMSFPVTLFWFLVCMNAVNLLDGLDGLAAGVSVCITLTLFIVSVLHQNLPSMILMACLSGASLGFLVFNFHPARIFLGDSGSMFLGFMLAGGALKATRSDASVALLVPVIALGLPILDTFLAVCRRWYKRLPLDTSDREHIHHLLVKMGWSHRRTVVALYVVCVVLGLCSVLVALDHIEVTVLVLGSLGVMVFVFGRLLAGRKLADFMAILSENREVHRAAMDASAAVERAIQGMGHAATIEELWSLGSAAFERMEFDVARLELAPIGGRGQQILSWMTGSVPRRRHGVEPDYWHVRLELGDGGRRFGCLELTRSSSGSLPFPDTPRRLDRFRSAMTRELMRMAKTEPVPAAREARGPLVAAVEAL